ncbi:MAG: zinc-binding domain-containing protein [Linnemannia elongata]|nr:MAG: zinc-binding domain-containing protein [Linnemannia elongata]
MDQETVPARSAIGSFYSNLLRLDTNNLNTIDIKEHPKWERRLIDAERKRRKSSGNKAPTKAEKSRILSVGEGKGENSSFTTKNTNSKPSSWSLYPELFGSVDVYLKKPFTFYDVDDDGLHALKEYDTFVSGFFLCSERCSKRGWSSGKIAISIRLYDHEQYNARIHHQRCRVCDALSRPTLDADTYGERVSYRLNKWSGFKMSHPIYGKKTTPPHDCENCEACSIGRCPHDKDDDKYFECRKNCRSDY